ncbi:MULTISPECIES: hypothetical protein [Methylomonas]|uniref:Uncharacterized protein n=1 Tax=Methylomonas koyamae TaxID=702114 RepID=A0A177NHQ3_9GAMM|nr:hypothetical protein [Methylomonas koyamae]OAI16739.1 hypothetical protein A1355_09520 [Methylomonas koyamae]
MGKRDRKGNFTRPINTREELKVVASRELLTFSFKDLDETQPEDEPQTLILWKNESLLISFLKRLTELSKLTRAEAENQQQLKVYGDFPPNSDFFCPKHVNQKVAWAVIKAVGGQKGVVAGYIVESTFYIVFLDKNHRFWISEKKHT